MLPKMGILADVLLTDNEESGGSTIRNLGIGMLDAYNWIVQFDRHGEGAAHYGYTEMIPLLAKHFPSIARGTYTCISAIEACSPCAAFNVGVGYENAHSEKCSLDSAVLQRQMLCFKRFYDEYLDVRLPHHGANAGDEIHTKRYKTVMWGEPQYPKKSHPMSLFADVDSGYYDDAYCGFCHMSVACWEPGYEVTRTKQSLCAACFDVVRDVLCMLPNSASEYTASDIDKIVDGTYCIKFKDRTLDVNGGTWVQTPACWEE
jgi:L-fucose isomerase-like protein